MLFGRQKYQGTGYSPEAARRMVDYYALQQTSYTFVSVPPGVIEGNAVGIQIFADKLIIGFLYFVINKEIILQCLYVYLL